MVKRPKTPEGPDPCKYYTCWKPYPQNADFELSEDYINFSRWIVNVLGDSGPLISLYYKPRVSAVIFAVDKLYALPERLLGEHRWDEFLKKPDKSEAGYKSQIFYSTYKTDRELQKDGWKCIPVEEYFFKNWGIGKWFTRLPYPPPHRCNVPPENKAEKPLCRPLPTSSAQVPMPQASAPVQRPVVGSSDWAQMRDKNTRSAPTPIITSGKSIYSPQNKDSGAANSKGKKTGGASSQASFPPLSSTAAPNTRPPTSASPVTNVRSIWENKPSNIKSPWSAPPTSTAHTVWKTKQSAPGASNVSRSQANPTTGNSSKVDTKTELPTRDDTNKTPDDDGETGKSRTRSSSFSSVHSDGDNMISAPSSAPSSPLPSPAHGQVIANIDVTEYDYDNDYDEEITEETYHEDWETASAYQPSEASAPAVHIGRKDKSNRWEYFVSAIEEEIDEPAVQENLWENVAVISPSTGSKAAAEAHAKEANEIICPVHKGKCKKGICETYKELKRAQRKKKKNEDRETKKNQKKEGKKESGEKEDNKKTNERGTAEAVVAKTKQDEQPNNKGVSQSQDRNKKPMSRRWNDYSSDEDDLGDVPSFSENRRTGGRKYDADEDFFD
ncbi:hypothetical protein F5887DRAFT_1282905 [Amanita rubescens]|nr:hypothetical protein F5887DRAFT_281545 [Amanita rubescens]KAF8344900.1 hypothetical protein F5887DRAFT_1282905 [Amanita rubescens]